MGGPAEKLTSFDSKLLKMLGPVENIDCLMMIIIVGDLRQICALSNSEFLNTMKPVEGFDFFESKILMGGKTCRGGRVLGLGALVDVDGSQRGPLGVACHPWCSFDLPSVALRALKCVPRFRIDVNIKVLTLLRAICSAKVPRFHICVADHEISIAGHCCVHCLHNLVPAFLRI